MNIKYNFSKKGITLTILIITIAVMLILLTTVVISINNVVNNSKLSSFATDLSTVEDLTKTYYMQNGAYPTTSENESALSQKDILDLVGEEHKVSFTEELKLNNDYNQNEDLGAFYKIDLSNLDIDSSKRGTKKDGNEQDIYVVCAGTNNIYYIKGINVKKTMYFSLSSKLTNKVKVNNNTVNSDTNLTSIQTIDGLTIKKMTKTWTNNIGIYVQANLQQGESIKLKATGVDEKTLITTTGNNEFNFNDLSEVSGFSLDESNTFKSQVQSEKKLIFTKVSSSGEIGKIEVDMSNYETTAPVYTTSQIDYENEYNMIPLNVSDLDSGIKEVRYEYLTKYDSSGEIQNYYSGVEQYDDTYLRARGKKAIPDKSGNVSLKVNKDIQGIQVLIIDKAGNTNSNVFTIGLYNESGNIYEGLNLRVNTTELLSYSLVFVNKSGILNSIVSTSEDGINFSNDKTLNINSSSTDNIKIVDDSYQNLGNIKYIKVIAKDNNSNTATRVFKLDERNKIEIGKITNENSTFNLKSTGTYYNPIIPKGFAAINVSNAVWGSSDGFNNGLVITDSVDLNGNSTGNEFVWIPVESTSDDEFDSKFNSFSWAETSDEFAKYSELQDDEFNLMNQSVKKNGGFYIARYESCIPQDGSTSKVDGTQSPVIKAGFNVWNNITCENAIKVSRSMYPNLDKITQYGLLSTLSNNTGVISTLVYARQWDSTLKFIEKDYSTYPTQSTNYGNYTDTQNSTKIIALSGANANYSLKNVYDMAGNVYEFTNEKYLTSGVTLRGGSYLTTGTSDPVSKRLGNTSSDFSALDAGFRIALYINN